MPAGSHPTGPFSAKHHNTMAKIQIDLDPKGPVTYTRTVNLPTPDGKGLAVEFTFKYRDQIEMAEMAADWQRRVEARSTGADVSNTDPVQAARDAIASDVRTLQEVASGWNIDAPFDDANLTKLCTRYAGAAMAVVLDYRVSLTQGRLGN